jgi:hypothetical protein
LTITIPPPERKTASIPGPASFLIAWPSCGSSPAGLVAGAKILAQLRIGKIPALPPNYSNKARLIELNESTCQYHIDGNAIDFKKLRSVAAGK